MAKRKRLDPARAGFLGDPGADLSAQAPTPAPGRGAALAPIAQVAGGAAASAALDELSQTLRQARDEGRMVLRLPLDAIHAEHLERDRIGADPEPLEALKASLRARGQQTPIEVVALPSTAGGAARYGLISGWRRLLALRGLRDEAQAGADDGAGRFDAVLALVRQPASAAEAYVAMVEENEIRADLSFWERARIVRQALASGAFETEKAALQTLFSAASYARRSKIKSFIPVVAALEGALAFPTTLSERAGLALSRRLEAEPGLADLLRRRLAAAAPVDAAAEAACLARALAETERAMRPETAATPPAEVGGLRLDAAPGRAVLSGPGVDAAFLERLKLWLQSQQQ